jgi:hypothetical protein
LPKRANAAKNEGVRGSRAALLALAVICVTAASATAAVTDRIQVGVPTNAATRGFASSLAVSLTSPAGFVRGCCYDDVSGAWQGPRYQATGNAARGGASWIDWSLVFERRRSTGLAIARRAAWRAGSEVAKGTIRVPHIVAGRRVGSLAGTFLVETEARPSARHLAVVVVKLGRNLHAVAVYDLSTPASDDAGTEGEFRVGAERPSAFNRRQALAVVRRVSVVGDLPPRRVTASVLGGAVSGTVRDDFGHPVSEAPARLLRRTGSGWRIAQKGTTSTSGRYVFQLPGRGSYRVVASLSGSAAGSTVVSFRR